MMTHTEEAEVSDGSAQIGLGLGVQSKPAQMRTVPRMTTGAATPEDAVPRQAELPSGHRRLRVRRRDKSTGDARVDLGAPYWASVRADADVSASGPHTSKWARGLRRHVLWGDMPTKRSECPEGPCPWVRCRHHMAVDVGHDGSLAVLRPGPWPKADLIDSAATEVASGRYETCSLRAAEDGPRGVEEIAAVIGMSRQQVAKDEQSALRKLRGLSFGASTLSEVLEGLSDDTGQVWPDWGGR